jgi:GNAT superfamily N-acetyltransferase
MTSDDDVPAIDTAVLAFAADPVARSTWRDSHQYLTVMPRLVRAFGGSGEPHWYLPLIGVDPAHQGKGHGDALMAYALQQCDRDHLPAYLESTNPRNIS